MQEMFSVKAKAGALHGGSMAHDKFLHSTPNTKRQDI